MTWTARITDRDYQQLRAHLHREDRDEHAAFLFAGCMTHGSENRLLVRQVAPVADAEFGPSDRGGYRQISARAIARAAIQCESAGLRLLWAHSHPPATRTVRFSEPDRATHERAHPHIIEMTGDMPVGSLVFGTDSMAGEVWMADGTVATIDHLDIVGARMMRLRPSPPPAVAIEERFARQVLMFGADGQATLRRMTVGVVGAGGGGSLLIQALAHLGVGHIIVIDHDRVDPTNLSRIVGARPRDARRRRLKVCVARRLVRSIDPDVTMTAIAGDVTHHRDAAMLLGCDFIFSATDTQFARFAVNAICHQYLIPGAQVGAKVLSGAGGVVELAYAAYRPIDLAGACLECGGAIDADALRREQLTESEKVAQNYIDTSGPDIADPSVITLNSIATALAMVDFQLAATNMFDPDITLGQRIYHAPERDLRTRRAASRRGCRWCDHDHQASSFGRGDDVPLPLSPGVSRQRTGLRGQIRKLVRQGGRGVSR